MNQVEARTMAEELTEWKGGRTIFIATTVCSARGEFEQGPDANVWGVQVYPAGQIETDPGAARGRWLQ